MDLRTTWRRVPFPISPLSKESVLKKHAILLVIAALALAACGSGGSGGGVAATVNGEDITVEEVEALITGDGEEIPKADFAGALGFLVQQQIVSEAAEADLGIVIPEDEITAEATALFEESANGQTREEFLEAQQITEELLQQFAHSQLLVAEIEREHAGGCRTAHSGRDRHRHHGRRGELLRIAHSGCDRARGQ